MSFVGPWLPHATPTLVTDNISHTTRTPALYLKKRSEVRKSSASSERIDTEFSRVSTAPSLIAPLSIFFFASGAIG